MKTYLFIITFLIIQINFGQMATILDPDGFTNIRKEPNGQSEIIIKIYEGEVFWYNYDAILENLTWIPVSVVGKNSVYEIEGFIHKSRLLTLEQATEYIGDDFYFHYNLTPYDSTNRKITKYENKWIETIDGCKPWGIDGYPPHTQIENIKVKINNKNILIEDKYFKDIFEASNNFKVIKIGLHYIVYQLNSDGAGGYELAWVFVENELKQKLVGSKI